MKFYRFYDPIVIDYLNGFPIMHNIQERTFNLIKETPCGYWIGNNYGLIGEGKRWVSKTSRKRYAYPTREEAWESYRARKKRHVLILSAQLRKAEVCLRISKEPMPVSKTYAKGEMR
jgi:hypothetical protein